MKADLRNLDNTSTENDTQSKPFRQRILETLGVSDVKVVDEDCIAFLSNECYRWISEKGRDIVRNRCDLEVS